jgi:2-iminoacetate synthase
MEKIDSNIQNQVLSKRAQFNYQQVSRTDVQQTLNVLKNHEEIDDWQFSTLLSPAATPFLEEIAKLAQNANQKHFGNSVALFTPLYLANYCQSNCLYCGFSAKNQICRVILSNDEIEAELEAIAQTGLQEILLLTGESWAKSSPEYIAKASKMASQLFKNVGVEVYPMNVVDYQLLHKNQVDYVTVFQETYDCERYAYLHTSGQKRCFPYRFDTQERALMGGMRGVAFGALLGLADFRLDAFATGLHAKYIQRKYPHAEISLSCPRLRPATGNDDFLKINAQTVTERDLLQIICAYRLFLPYANITVSTRESATFRNHAAQICATKISAGVDTGIGRHSDQEAGDEQFEIADQRSLHEMINDLKSLGLQPVINDHIF